MTKQHPSDWEKMFTTSDRGLISKIFKELGKLDIETQNNPIFKMSHSAKTRILYKGIPNG